jgi:uncharacterized protein involved in exopolysaccharide biosynthesis
MDDQMESSERQDPATDAAPAGGGGDELSLAGVVTFMLRHRRILVGMPLLAILAVIGAKLTGPRQYASTASFAPEVAGGMVADLSGLASQFGIAVGSRGRENESPAFYAMLVRSRTILEPVAEIRFTAHVDGQERTGTIAELYGLKGSSGDGRSRAARRELARSVSTSVTRETGVVELRVTARTPLLAEQITTAILDQVNEFNVDRRQSRARAERQFVETRLREAEQDLREAESRLQAFLQANRRYGNSPELGFERDRLDRDVATRQQLRITLQQNHEQARIEEVRDLPVITVIEMPNIPERPVGRNTVGTAFLAAVGAFTLGLFIAFVGQALSAALRVQRQRQDQELLELHRTIGSDLRRPWRILTGKSVRKNQEAQ